MLQQLRISEPTAGNHQTTYVAPAGQSFRAALFIVVALTTYLYIPLLSGGRLLVPSFPTVALMPLLFWTVRRSLSLSDKLFLAKIIFVLILSIAFSPGYIYIPEKFLSVVQFGLAVTVTVMTVRLMQEMRLEMLERALLIFWCLFLIGSLLEVAGIIRGISDAFRSWAFEGQYTVYDADERDLSFVGWVRPKLFSTEPSNVSKMFIVAINAWLLVRVTQIKAATVAVATGVMFVIMGSPMFVISVALTLTILVWNRRASTQARAATVIAALVVGALFVTFFGESATSTLERRIGNIGAVQADGDLQIRSENLRGVVPWLTLADTWSRWPFFGVGFGGKEIVLEESRFTTTSYRVALGSNAAAEVGTYLGLVGGALFVWLFLMEAAHTGVRRRVALLGFVFMFSLMMGSLDSFKYWGHIALLWGALAVADSNSAGVARSASADGLRASGFDKQTFGAKGRNPKLQPTDPVATRS